MNWLRLLFNLNMRKRLLRNIFFTSLFIIILIIFLRHTSDTDRNYDFISKANIIENLHEELAENFTSSAVSDCEYHERLNDDSSWSPHSADADLPEGHRIKDGGEYSPVCKPKYSVALIVPYRDMAELLRGFLVHMHMFLSHQRIHYRIFVVEQVDSRPFNRAKLINIGAKAAMKAGYPCLILHDVDLLPLKPANLYACTKTPRHMALNIHKYSFIVPYMSLFGGVIALIAKQFKAINGMSNEFLGFGGEDDDFYIRLSTHNLHVCRFDMTISKYHVLAHDTLERNNYDRAKSMKRIKTAKERMKNDGLNSLFYTEVATVMHPLFTHIMVDL